MHAAPVDERLTSYRTAVDDLVGRLRTAAGEPAAAADAVRQAVEEPVLRAVLDRLPGAAEDTLSRIAVEVGGFRPSGRSNAATAAALTRILLLQQIDVLWWSAATPFTDAAAVTGSPDLVSLHRLRRAGLLRFRYRVAASGLPVRACRHLARRWAPQRSPRSSGLSHPVARPAMVGLLNEVADRFTAEVPGWRGGLWVNCIVRSVADQRRLQELGYSATLPSAHCTGWAADVEMDWPAQHGVAAPLQALLSAYRDAGVLNVIDEGQAWHVCLNPAAVDRYTWPPATARR